MHSRLAVAVLFLTILPAVSYGQESDVVLGSPKDIHGVIACGADGTTLFAHPNPSGSTSESILRVSRDGSTMTFQLPKEVTPIAAAADGSGVNVLAVYPHHRNEDWRHELFRLDNQANVLGQYSVAIDFHPMKMAILPSGKMIVVGHKGDLSYSHRKEWTYVGAVLDADGGVIARFDFPSQPEGGKWTFPHRQMIMAGDGAAYIVLETESESAIGIAKISETGRVDIKIISEPPDNDERRHHIWLLGPGVAVEEYTYRGEKTPFRMHYDEYDLNSGEKIATKVSSTSGSAQCYFGAEVGWTNYSAHADPSRHLSSDTLHLIFSKLENQAVNAPPASH